MHLRVNFIYIGSLGPFMMWCSDSACGLITPGSEFESCKCHSKNTVGEEGNGEPPHKIHLPRLNSDPSLLFLLCSKSGMQCSLGSLFNDSSACQTKKTSSAMKLRLCFSAKY